MNQREQISEFIGYNRWATGRMIDHAAELPEVEFLQPDDTPFGSIRNQLVHILDTQWGWIDICIASLNDVPRQVLDLIVDDYPDIDSIRDLCERVESATDEFLNGLPDAELDRDIDAHFEWGSLKAPLWLALIHLVNHGTQHRSELAMKLTNLGHSPGMVDLIFYHVTQKFEAGTHEWE